MRIRALYLVRLFNAGSLIIGDLDILKISLSVFINDFILFA